MIHPTGYFRAKTNTLISLGQRALCERFGGEVPGTLDDLVTLPGVGRKTANMVLGDAFSHAGPHGGYAFCPAGTAVRLDGPDRPRPRSSAMSRCSCRDRSGPRRRHRLTWHGRRVCHALALPHAAHAGSPGWCPSFGLGPTDEKTARKLVKPGPLS